MPAELEKKEAAPENDGEEYDVKFIEDDSGETHVKVVKGRVVEQFHHEETYPEHLRRLILYSKIAAVVSLTSLVIALTLLGLSTTADAISESSRNTTNLVSILLFFIGLSTFIFALQLEKKSKLERIKKLLKLKEKLRAKNNKPNQKRKRKLKRK